MAEFTFPQAHCQVGLARCDITPPVGIYHRMWGAATHDRATGVHQPLTATALAFSSLSGKDVRVILAIDHCLFWGPVIDKMLERLERETSLPRSTFAITFSHTHAAGLMDPARTDLPGGELIPPYLESLTEKLAVIAQVALDRMRPAWIQFATGACTLAAQRDFLDEATKQIVCGFNPVEPADDTLLVARITTADGETLGTIVNYACHPTTLAYQNTLISPDYPGAMREVIETATGAPCVFLQGAPGDLGPREGYVGHVDVAERNGRQLGYAALSALESLGPPGQRFVYQGPVVSGATLGAWDYAPLTSEENDSAESFSWKELTVPLAYRSELPTPEQLEQDMAKWLQAEETAQSAKDDAGYRDAHAMVERMRRLETRIGQLPKGREFPLPVKLGRVGDSVWVFVEGEHYQWLQQSLRDRFWKNPVFVVTLTNGWRCSYLPTATEYGKGIYQETVAVLEKGCLEELERVIAEEIGRVAAP